MPTNKLRYCLLCNRYDRIIRSNYTRISTSERQTKLIEGYRRRHNGEELTRPIWNQLVHQKCYNRTVQTIPIVDPTTSSEPMVISMEQKPEDHDEEEQEQTSSVIQCRSRMPLPSHVNKRLFERRQRACAICHQYAYKARNKIKQIVSNYTANKLAEGYSHIFKRPYGASFLDAYMHQACFKRLYSRYQYHTARKFQTNDVTQYSQESSRQSVCSPHETRSRSSLKKGSEDEQSTTRCTTGDTTDLSIEKLFTTSIYAPVTTIHSDVEQSARSCLFRPCMPRLTADQIAFYTKPKVISQTMNEEDLLATDSSIPKVIEPSSIPEPPTTNDSMIHSNHDSDNHDVDLTEQDSSPDCIAKHLSTPMSLNVQQKIYTAARIRHRYLKPPPLAKPANPLVPDHSYISAPSSIRTIPSDIERLSKWLTDELQSVGSPLSMSVVTTKHRALSEDDEKIIKTVRESICRERLRHRLEKFYPNQFVFVTPSKREGTYVALNDIDRYIRLAIQNAKREKEKTIEPSSVSSIVLAPVPVDLERETCETVMKAIRRIRLHIRDPNQVNSVPSIFIRNLIGLITASEKNFEKIVHDHSFLRMIAEDLFENVHEKLPNPQDKNLRNMSLASDLISARHERRWSQKHFLLADELMKKDFHCTPRQVMTLLHRYGHTCSYKSYNKMKAAKQRTEKQLGEELLGEIEKMMANEENSSESDMDLLEL